MKTYIVITTQGFTQDSSGNEVENAQVIGQVTTHHYHEAAQKAKEYLIENKMNFSRFILYELADGTPIRYHIDMI